MATVNQEFQSAPMGRCVIRTVVFAFGVMLAVEGVHAALVFRKLEAGVPPETRLMLFLAPLAGLIFLFPVFLFERAKTAKFGIEENVLVLGRKRFPLAGLASVQRDPKIMRWAVKLGGNGGLGAIRGRFWSKRVGRFYAFLTGTENAVLLRWQDKVVAVSPSDPENFIACAKSAAGLR